MSHKANTIIVLRHDSSVRWEQSEVVLRKGELGIAYLDNGSIIIKAGDGVNTWDKLNSINAALSEQVKQLENNVVLANNNIATNTANIATVGNLANSNSSALSGLTTTLTSLQEITASHNALLAGVKNSVVETIDEAIKAIVLPKSSDEITVEDDGALTINTVSTDKLVQGEEVLVLDSGSATK